MADLIVRVEFDESKVRDLINKFKEENPDFIAVVRCKNCIRFGEDHDGECSLDDCIRNENDYCSFAERRALNEPKEE